MSAGDYLLGVALLALVVVPLAAGTVCVRARLLADWSGAPARVAEAVLGLAALILVAEALGTVGLLERVPLVVACAAAGGAAWWWSRRGGRGSPHPAAVPGSAAAAGGSRPAPPQHGGRLAIAVALAACAAVAVAWLDRTDFAIHSGMTDPDTLWYHLPVAARFAQEGSTTALHFTSYEPLTPFHPANGSLVHAVGMVAFGNDLLSPFVNLGWLALALAAGWCVGRPFGAGPATLLGTAVVAGSPILTGMDGGTGKDDVMGVALLLAAVALLVNGGRARAPTVIAAVAGGLLLGVKLSMVVPALLLAAVAVAAAQRGRRLATAGIWAAALLVAGGYWYARNLAHTGNPAPWVDLGPLSLDKPELAPYTERWVTGSIAERAGEIDGFWGDWFVPAAETALGPAWWAVLALTLAGGAAVAAVGASRLHRLLGAAAVVIAVAYAITPGSAGGSPQGIPHLVLWNMRHLTPALALGLVALPLLPALRGRRQWVALAALGVVFVAMQFSSGVFELWGARPSVAAAVAGVAAVLAVAAAGSARSLVRGRGLAAVAAIAALAVAAAGYKAQDVYFDYRYADSASALALPFRWARGVHDARIGIVGFFLQYPLYGGDLSNRVQYVGVDGGDGEFRSVASCAEWRERLAAGDYDYVVTAPFNYPWGASSAYPREARWTETDPAARRIDRAGPLAIFELTGDPDPATCDSDGFPAQPEAEPQATGTRPPTD
ncbi:MAG TPA: hypothetical protein VF712_00260 [Thermoleophilaceae bacterium]